MPDLVSDAQQMLESGSFHLFHLVEPGIKNTSLVVPFIIPPKKELKRSSRTKTHDFPLVILLFLFFEEK